MRHSTFAHYAQSKNKEFRPRGNEPMRLENFSDACFGMAITVLLISTTPPTSFEQIRRFVWEIIPFGLCIAFLVLVWYEHFQFFYRYGLRNGKIIVLNTLFLVIVLFYVYPFKFLATLLLIPISMLFGVDELRTDVMHMIKPSDVGELMVIYGLGSSAMFFVMVFMYREALSQSKELELNDIEVFDTKASIRTNLLMALIPLVSVILAVIFRKNSFLAGAIPGFAYFLYVPVMWWNGTKIENERKLALDNHFSSSDSSNAGEPI